MNGSDGNVLIEDRLRGPLVDDLLLRPGVEQDLVAEAPEETMGVVFQACFHLGPEVVEITGF